MQKDTKEQNGALNREAKLNQWQFVGGWWWWLVVAAGSIWWRFGGKALIKSKFLEENCIC